MAQGPNRQDFDIVDQIGSLRIRQLYELSLLLNYRSMGKIAEHIGVSQPTLSKHLTAIEQIVGVKLFNRGYRLSLTPSGTILAESAVHVLNYIEHSVHTCRDVAFHGVVELRVESDGSYFRAKDLGNTLIQAFLTEHKNVVLKSVPLINKSLKRSLEENTIDAGYWYDFGDVQEIIDEHYREGLGLIYLSSERMIVWAHGDHPILLLDKVMARDIAQCRIMSSNPIGQARSYNMHDALFKTAAFKNYPMIKDVRLVRQLLDFLTLEPRDSIFILPESFTKESAVALRHGMRWRYIDDEAICHTFFAYSRETKNQAVIDLVDYIIEHNGSVIDNHEE